MSGSRQANPMNHVLMTDDQHREPTGAPPGELVFGDGGWDSDEDENAWEDSIWETGGRPGTAATHALPAGRADRRAQLHALAQQTVIEAHWKQVRTRAEKDIGDTKEPLLETARQWLRDAMRENTSSEIWDGLDHLADKLDGAGLIAIAAVLHARDIEFKNLRTLRLYYRARKSDIPGAPQPDDGIVALAYALSKTGITHLCLECMGEDVGEEGAKALASALPFTRLAVLDLDGDNSAGIKNNVTDEAVRYLAAAIGTGRTLVEELSLNFTKTSDTGFKCISMALPRARRLKRLWLQGTDLTDNGVRGLCDELMANPTGLQKIGRVLPPSPHCGVGCGERRRSDNVRMGASRTMVRRGVQRGLLYAHPLAPAFSCAVRVTRRSHSQAEQHP